MAVDGKINISELDDQIKKYVLGQGGGNSGGGGYGVSSGAKGGAGSGGGGYGKNNFVVAQQIYATPLPPTHQQMYFSGLPGMYPRVAWMVVGIDYGGGKVEVVASQRLSGLTVEDIAIQEPPPWKSYDVNEITPLPPPIHGKRFHAELKTLKIVTAKHWSQAMDLLEPPGQSDDW